MWNDTMEHENGAGWAVGESSFMTDRKPDSKSTTLGERLPVPVTIANLIEHFSAEDDKYVIGNFRFATVQTVGIVKTIQQDGTSYIFELHDPNNEEMEYRALKYDSENTNFDLSSIVEGTRVRAIGKLKGFDGSNSIMLFNISPLPNDKDFTIFELEAEAARLFFQNNLNDKLKFEAKSAALKGMLAPPRSRTAAQATQATQQSSQGGTKERLYPVQKEIKKEGALKERVTAVLKAVPEESREEGSKIDWIAAQVGEKDVNAIRECLNLMIELGLAYTTVDDDSYSII